MQQWDVSLLLSGESECFIMCAAAIHKASRALLREMLERLFSSACFTKAQGELQKFIKTPDEGRDAREWKEHTAVRKLQEQADGPMDDSFRLRVVDKEVGSAEAGPKKGAGQQQLQSMCHAGFQSRLSGLTERQWVRFRIEEKTVWRSSLKS